MNILFHVPELSRVVPCLNNALNYLKAVDTNADKLRIVFNGNAVNSLVDKTESADQWKDLAKKYNNIQLDVCSNSLRGMGIVTESLIRPVSIVPSAILTLVTLQNEGWIYLRP
ncbi:DsrE family protein [Rouxiella badensis]|uniref:DsrE family protein n=1 Tax=Rahnella perminowiae TaxID=2816244 RepID=A0ABS6KVA3_9GAMM|nr:MULTISPECIES: DsrE family protein [Yersiniaceae]MBU9809955.1 DsrE family protein [Rahnella perminowiae]MBU9833536.1 DsrE family protein [Rahnella perminowiae]MBU9848693.1 DsrE family protein [Rahnella aceris]MBU9858581.1 DsrE family protein [Rahnella aceris]MBU9863988.1 DsrE family protein [Rahnella aceris]